MTLFGILTDTTARRINGSTREITDAKRAEQEREQLIAELQDAMARVRTLRGLLPICSSCKRIRDDKGYWNQPSPTALPGMHLKIASRARRFKTEASCARPCRTPSATPPTFLSI